jgi:small subunit ribosomal protein S2
MYYVTERWPGGLLTNMATIKKSINRLRAIEKMREDGTFDKLTKKEVARLEKELAKLNKNFSGIAKMERMPKAIVIVDIKKEETAVLEARRLGIPIVGLIDTNSNPDPVAFPIPGNDDATKSIAVVIKILADAVIEGRKKFLSYLAKDAVVETPAEEKLEQPLLAPDEEVKIQEIEEIVEGQQPVQDETKSLKKGRVKAAGDDRLKPKKKI